MYIELAPGDFFVGNRSAVRAKRSGAVAYLAEIAPERYIMPFQVLVHHGHHANGKIAGNASANLKESNALSATVGPVPFGKPYHIFNAAFYGACLQFAFNYIARENVSGGAVFPAWHYNRYIF